MAETSTKPNRASLVRILIAVNVVAAVALVTVLVLRSQSNGSTDAAPLVASTTSSSPPTTTTTTTTAPPATTTTTTTIYEGLWDPRSVGTPYGEHVEGLLTFRGSPTRSYYGEGPVPTDPEVLWRFPRRGGMCSRSTTGGETTTWCGTGWTGQPAVWNRSGEIWLAFGAYDRAIHVLDGLTGERRFDDFPTGDIIKGSVTVDPDGFPLLYTGSRDGFLRALALDRPDTVEEVWKLSAGAVSPTKWNDDWDGAPLVLDGLLLEGGENSQFHVLELKRSFGPDGLVQLDPVMVFNTPGWDDELIRAVGNNVSIENSVAVSGNTAYFANSGGLVQGWDMGGLIDPSRCASAEEKEGDGEGDSPECDPTQTFRFWMGDDVDASIVIDDEGFLYVASEFERGLQRARDVGQIVKLDPNAPDDPIVWSISDDERQPGGVWATPAIDRDVLYVATNGGRLMGIDRFTGEIRWTKRLPGPLWQSPVVVDDVLIQGDCGGTLRGYDVQDTTVEPEELWRVELGGCIESTPAVWDGWIYVGTRAGAVYGIADP
jgi:outer membrane protein assembly factor BamB